MTTQKKELFNNLKSLKKYHNDFLKSLKQENQNILETKIEKGQLDNYILGYNY